ncbi:MAG: glycosyltransferase [Burkholderiales bacterium]|nr:glycosyltransferase [Burkholderiales bacterium]
MKKSILFVWPDLGYGGAEVVLMNLVKYLIDKYHITILCYEQCNKFIIPEGITVVYAVMPAKNKLLKSWNKLVFLIKWLKLARRHNFYLLNEVPFLVIMAGVVSLLTHKKYLVWAHSCRSEMGSNFGWLLTRVYKYNLRTANTIICVSNTCAKSMHEYVNYPLKNIKIINNILTFNIPNEKLKLSLDTVNLCAIGRLAHEKNFALLIEALATALPQLKFKPHLYLCGKGEERNRLIQQINQLNLDKVVTMVGYTDIPLAYIAACDIFVSPSNSESAGMVVCEALYYHKPIIATNTGAVEILENGKYGIITEVGNVAQLAQALILLINNETLRCEYSKKTIGALDKFSTAGIINKWQELFESIN